LKRGDSARREGAGVADTKRYRNGKAITIDNPEPFIIEIRMDLRKALSAIIEVVNKNIGKGIIMGAILVVLSSLGVPIHI